MKTDFPAAVASALGLDAGGHTLYEAPFGEGSVLFWEDPDPDYLLGSDDPGAKEADVWAFAPDDPLFSFPKTYVFRDDDGPYQRWERVGGGFLSPTERTCLWCDGGGIIHPPGEDCERCEGDGYVDSPGGAYAYYRVEYLEKRDARQLTADLETLAEVAKEAAEALLALQRVLHPFGSRMEETEWTKRLLRPVYDAYAWVETQEAYDIVGKLEGLEEAARRGLGAFSEALREAEGNP